MCSITYHYQIFYLDIRVVRYNRFLFSFKILHAALRKFLPCLLMLRVS